MPTYKWQGIDVSGKTHRGKGCFASIEELEKELFSQGIALLSTRKTKQGKPIPTKALSELFHDLATLLEGGIPLVNALNLTKMHAPTRYKPIIAQFERDVSHGKQLAGAFALQRAHFSPIIIKILDCGEKSGKLHETLGYLAKHLSHKYRLSQKIKRAAYGPIITITFALLITTGILMCIVPQLEPLIAHTKTLHWSTKAMLGTSKFLQLEQNRIVMLTALIISLLCIRLLRKSRTLRIFISKIVLKLPIVGQITIDSNLSQFAHILAMLIKSGYPLAQSLALAQQVCKNSAISQEIEQIAHAVNRGLSLSEAFISIQSPHYPKSFISLIKLGEQTGKLEHMLDKSADRLEQQLTQKIIVFTTLFQPALLIFTGLFIAALLFSIYLPLFDIFAKT